jgi:hypothetical protein
MTARHEAHNGHAMIGASSGTGRDDGADARVTDINTLQCAGFAVVSARLAVGILLTGHQMDVLAMAICGITCVIVKVALTHAWLRYSAR